MKTIPMSLQHYDLETKRQAEKCRRTLDLLEGKLSCSKARSRHKRRIPIYAAETAKLTVQPGAVLETQWGDMPIELVEMIASHLHPCDVGRLRSVSSGWRAVFWQERVVRASLRGCGPCVDQVLMLAMFMHSGEARRAIFDQMDVSGSMSAMLARNAKGVKDTTLWEPVLDSMQWWEYVGAYTHSTVCNICVVMVPFATNSTREQHVPEMYALEALAEPRSWKTRLGSEKGG